MDNPIICHLFDLNQEARAFLGTVENVSDEMLTRVRVEIHLSSGKELGPTVAADLEPGEEGAGEHGHSHEEGEGEHN